MIPSNFPERKNQRRKGALARLRRNWPQNEDEQKTANIELLSLESHIVADARDVRTKIRRTSRRQH